MQKCMAYQVERGGVGIDDHDIAVADIAHICCVAHHGFHVNRKPVRSRTNDLAKIAGTGENDLAQGATKAQGIALISRLELPPELFDLSFLIKAREHLAKAVQSKDVWRQVRAFEDRFKLRGR